jgi:hypothetical protein
MGAGPAVLRGEIDMKASRYFSCLFALIAAATISQTASAQRFGLFGSRSNSLISLAAYEAVQKDLGVGPEAAGKLGSLSEEFRDAITKETTALGIDYGEIGDLPQAERAAKMRDVTEKTSAVTSKLTAEYMPKLQEVLSADQLSRLRQIQIQAQGADALVSAEIATVLELSSEQKKGLADLISEYQRKQQELTGDFQERFARIREMNTERDNRAIDLLTAGQKEKYAVLKGQPFDVSQLRFGRRGKN